MDHRIRLGTTGNTLRHIPHRAVAPATYRIEDLIEDPDAATRVLASGSATVDSASATTDAAAGATTADATKIPVTATAGLTVGGRYWIESARGEGEIVEVVGVVTNDYVVVATPLLNEYATGSTVTGLEISAAFPDIEVTEERTISRWPMRVVWEYTAAGQLYRVQDIVTVTRDTAIEGGIAEALEQMRMMFPDLMARAQSDGRDVARVVQGCRNELVSLMRARNLDPEQTLVGDIGRDLLVWRACHTLAMCGLTPGSRTVEDWERDARKRFEQLFSMVNVGVRGAAFDLNQDHQSGGGSVRHRAILGSL